MALAICACQNGYSVYFTSLDSMIRSLPAADRARQARLQATDLRDMSQLHVRALISRNRQSVPAVRWDQSPIEARPTLLESSHAR